MKYIILIMQICSTADSSLCTSERITLDKTSMNSCLFNAPKHIAMMNYVNPDWEIKDWHCEEEVAF